MGFCKNLGVLDKQQGQNGQLLHPQLWLQGSSPLATGLNPGMLRISYYLVLITSFTNQVWMRLNDEDTGNTVKLVPETFGMNVPNACTIVIIAGE